MGAIPTNFARYGVMVQLLRLRPQQAVRRIWAEMARRRENFPITASIEVTNYCNLACSTCPQPLVSGARGYLDMDLFKKIVDECCQFSSFYTLVFTGLGEPLLHPQLMDMGRYAKSKGIPYVRTYTNCVLLNKEKTEELLRNPGFDEITLSLNASTPEIYERITGSRNYDRVTENIEYFLARRNALKARNPFVNLHLLKLNDVSFDKEEFIKRWSPLLKFRDRVAVKYSHSYAGQVKDPGVKVVLDNSKRVPCGQLRNSLCITWDGDVSPCCTDTFRRLKIGSVCESSLQELWHSPLRMNMLELHRQKKYHCLPLCEECETWWYLSRLPNPHSLAPAPGRRSTDNPV